jgi:hypothetical protein
MIGTVLFEPLEFPWTLIKKKKIIERQRSEDDSMNKTGEEKLPISWGP